MPTTILEPPPTADPRVSTLHLATRDIAKVFPGVMPFGVALGVTAGGYGSGALATLVGSVAVYGGSAQLTTMSLLHTGAGLAAAVAAGAVVQSRVLLYAAALDPWFRGQPLWFRLIGSHFILDQTYLSTIERPDIRGNVFRRYWFQLGLLLLAVWSGAVAAGLAIGPMLPSLPHLVLVGTALFVAMLVPKLVDRTSVVAAAGGVAGAAVALVVVPPLAVLVGSVSGVAAAIWHAGRGRR